MAVMALAQADGETAQRTLRGLFYQVVEGSRDAECDGEVDDEFRGTVAGVALTLEARMTTCRA